MPLFLNTKGKRIVSVAICDRCRMKRAAADLISDPDTPGMRVCVGCADEVDPYTFAPRQTEDITVPFVRKDVDIT
jgi:hypothetical protein